MKLIVKFEKSFLEIKNWLWKFNSRSKDCTWRKWKSVQSTCEKYRNWKDDQGLFLFENEFKLLTWKVFKNILY